LIRAARSCPHLPGVYFLPDPVRIALRCAGIDGKLSQVWKMGGVKPPALDRDGGWPKIFAPEERYKI